MTTSFLSVLANLDCLGTIDCRARVSWQRQSPLWPTPALLSFRRGTPLNNWQPLLSSLAAIRFDLKLHDAHQSSSQLSVLLISPNRFEPWRRSQTILNLCLP